MATAFLAMGGLSAATGGLDALLVFKHPTQGKADAVGRTDPTIDFTYASGVAPVAGYPSSDYSVVWSGSVTAPADGEYTFLVTADDDARLWVGTQWIAQRLSFNGGAATTVQGKATLKAGTPTPLLLRFWQFSGKAQVKLEWSGPGLAQQVVPATALSPGGWTRIEAPASSYESPVSIVVHCRPRAVPQLATAPANRLAAIITPLSPTAELAELTLDPGRATTVAANAGGQTANASITWKPVDFLAPPARVAIRAGSKILVKPRAGGVPCITSGYDRKPTTVIPVNGAYQIPFVAAGTYVLDDNKGGATVQVKVLKSIVDAGYENETLIIPADYIYGFKPPVVPADAATLVVGGSYSHNVCIANGANINGEYVTGVAIYGAGETSYGFLRLVDNGSILSLVKVQGVNVSISPAVIDVTNPDGSRVAHAFAYVYPFVRNLQYTCSMRAHTATFAGGKTAFTVRTDGSSTSLGEPGFTEVVAKDGRKIGSLRFTVLFPAGESKWCFTAVPHQLPH